MKKLLLLLCCIISVHISSAQDGPKRDWKGNSLPVNAPSGFSKNDQFQRISDSTFWKRVDNKWVPSDWINPWKGSALKGDKGDPGIQGPPGPVGGSSGSATSSLGFVRWVGSWNEYVIALQDAERGLVKSIQIYQNLQQTSRAIYPKQFRDNLEIEGHGAVITDVVGLDTTHIRSFASTSESDPYMDCQIHFNNISFVGKSRNGIGFFIGCTYQTTWEKCRFSTYKSAIVAAFDLQGKVDNCRFWNCAYSGISVIYYPYPGGGPQESQSNHFVISNSCFRSDPGDFCNIYARGVSGLWIVHCIGEGGDESQGGLGADYMVFFDDGNSNTVKECNIDMSHGEFKPRIALFGFDVLDGMFSVTKCYSQKSNVTLVYVKNKGAYPNIFIEKIPHFAPGMKIGASDGNVRFQLWNMPAEWDANNVSNWVDGKKGNFTLQVGNQPDGRKPYFDLFGRRL